MLKDIFSIYRYLVRNLKDLCFPAYCLGCESEGNYLCPACKYEIKAQKNNPGLSPVTRTDENGALDGVASVFEYREGQLVARLIHAYKYDFLKELHQPLGEIMADFLKEFSENNLSLAISEPIFCPVPLHKVRQKWRGFNQSSLLAGVIARNSGGKLEELLQRTKFATPQMELSKEKRITNVLGAFSVNPRNGNILPGMFTKPVFLVDDVATTLSTLKECALTLKNEGFKRVYAIVLARVC